MGADPNPFRYCGEYFDVESGAYYLRARYYDPSVGRFTQEDTHWNASNMIYGDEPQQIGEYEDPLGTSRYTYAPQITAVMQAGNLYGYTGGNPLMFADPSGKAFMFVTAIVGLTIGAIAGGIISYIQSGEISWQAVATGAAIGCAIGLVGGAALAYATTGSITASTTVVLSAGESWAATMAASGATTPAAIGRTFEKWLYAFHNVATNAQQVFIKGIGRIDAFLNGRIYELKNYNWEKYSPSQIKSIIENFISQAQRYLTIDQVNGQRVREVVYYFIQPRLS